MKQQTIPMGQGTYELHQVFQGIRPLSELMAERWSLWDDANLSILYNLKLNETTIFNDVIIHLAKWVRQELSIEDGDILRFDIVDGKSCLQKEPAKRVDRFAALPQDPAVEKGSAFVRFL